MYASEKHGSQTTFFLNDHLGGLLATMSGAVGGAVHSSILRDAWGKQVHKAGTPTTAYLYTGQRCDELLGLYDYNARWYDPGTGRFVSADTVVPEPQNPIAFDRFAYVANNPIRLADPSGHSWIDVIKDLAVGAASQFAHDVGVGPAANDLAAKPNETTAMTTGRLIGAFASTAVGIAEMAQGAGMIGAGGSIAAGGTIASGGALTAPALGVGAGVVITGGALVAHGALTAVDGIISTAKLVQKLSSGHDPAHYPVREGGRLPQSKHGEPVPDVELPHSQLNQRDDGIGPYDQAREWNYDENGNVSAERDIDFTDHGIPSKHPNPHQHSRVPNNPTTAPRGGYKRGPAEPLYVPQ